MKFSVTCYIRASPCDKSTFVAIKMFPRKECFRNRKEANIRNMRKGQDVYPNKS